MVKAYIGSLSKVNAEWFQAENPEVEITEERNGYGALMGYKVLASKADAIPMLKALFSFKKMLAAR